jgi:hypothetical protein
MGRWKKYRRCETIRRVKMSNTIRLRPEDIDRRRYLSQLLESGMITPEQVAELRQILENERYLAIMEGNTDIMFSITLILEKIDDYMKKKGISTSFNVRPSNVT